MISIRYLVKDVAASIKFYSESLGFELKQQFGPAMTIVAKDSLTLWLAGPPSSAAQAMPDGRKPEPGGWNRFVHIWIDLINKLGGNHYGYFLPSQDDKAKAHGRFSFPGIGTEGATNVGIAIFSFPDWPSYEKYRAEAGNYDECRRATAIANETKCFTSYERNFMTPIFGT